MPLSINDNITLGSYTFPYNPGSYGVSFEKFATTSRSINGKLQVTFVGDGLGGVMLKRKFSMGGISFDMLDSIIAEFTKSTTLTFVSPENKTYIVYFGDYEYDIAQDDPFHPTYTIELEEA